MATFNELVVRNEKVGSVGWRLGYLPDADIFLLCVAGSVPDPEWADEEARHIDFWLRALDDLLARAPRKVVYDLTELRVLEVLGSAAFGDHLLRMQLAGTDVRLALGSQLEPMSVWIKLLCSAPNCTSPAEGVWQLMYRRSAA